MWLLARQLDSSETGNAIGPWPVSKAFLRSSHQLASPQAMDSTPEISEDPFERELQIWLLHVQCVGELGSVPTTVLVRTKVRSRDGSRPRCLARTA
jgi:hypothetical protein